MNWKLIMQCSFFRLRAAAGSLIISLVLLCLSYKWNKHTKQNLSIKLCMKYRNLLLNLQLCASLFFTLKMESVWNTFWSKNDGEKWSRKDIFEIHSCGSHFFLILFHRNEAFSTKLQIQYKLKIYLISAWRDFKSVCRYKTVPMPL